MARNPVASGDKWTLQRIATHLSIPGGDALVTKEFEVTSWEDWEVTLTAQGILQPLDADEANNLSGNTHGTIVLDAISGFIKSASLNRDVEASLTLSFGEQNDGSPITYKEEIFVEILKL